MAQHGPRLVIPVDVKKKPHEQALPLHNRWHPEIPPVAEVRTGDVFRVEMMDFSGGGITREYTIDDIKHADLSIRHSKFRKHFFLLGFSGEGLECLRIYELDANEMPGMVVLLDNGKVIAPF